MKKVLLLASMAIFSSCASIDGINKSPNCVVWKDQKIWGPYSIDVVENKVFWNMNCKGYHSSCQTVSISLDENKNILSDTKIIGKIENDEVRLLDNHELKNIIGYKVMRVYPDLKQLKTQNDPNAVWVDSYYYNAKCTSDTALLGGVALDVIHYHQFNKKQK